MRVLVACGFSGVVRDDFRSRGHDAVSFDLLPSERPGQHSVEGQEAQVHREPPGPDRWRSRTIAGIAAAAGAT